MCDSYISLGPENIEASDVLSGFASFVVVALGGTMIGIFWGFLTGFVTKYTHRVLVIEPIFIFIMSYVAYVNAEAFQMSGILS
jgi:sodium/hydrogen exchanger-like protein 3